MACGVLFRNATNVSVNVKLAPLEVARATLVVVAVGFGCYLVWRVQEVLFLLVLAILLATAIEPLVKVLRRGPFTRGTGVLAVYTLIILVIAVPAYIVIPNVASQAAAFMTAMPDRLEVLRLDAVSLRPVLVANFAAGLIQSAEQAVRAPQQPGNDQIVEAGTTAAHTLLGLVTVFVLAFYWLVERASIKRVVLRAVPTRLARDVNTVWMEVEEKLGGWVRGQMILMLAIACMATVGYVLLGIPNPALLGAAAGLFELVPMIGPFLAFAPAVLVALVTVDGQHALLVVAYALVIQQIESNVLVPRIMGSTVGISPLTVLLALLVGGSLAGLPGAFLAVPIAAALQVILAHALHTEDPSQAEEHPDPRDREEHQGGSSPLEGNRAA